MENGGTVVGLEMVGDRIMGKPRIYELMGGPQDGGKIRIFGPNQPIAVYTEMEPGGIGGYTGFARDWNVRFPVCYYWVDGRFVYSRRGGTK